MKPEDEDGSTTSVTFLWVQLKNLYTKSDDQTDTGSNPEESLNPTGTSSLNLPIQMALNFVRVGIIVLKLRV